MEGTQKKNLWNYFWVMLVLSLFGCAGTKAEVQIPQTSGSVAGVDLDTAVKELAKQIDAKLPQGTKVALVSVASPSTAFSEQVLLRLESALVSTGKVVIVDRANLDKIRAEQGFQLSGEVDDDSAKAIGKLLGAGAIITGSTVDMGDVYGLALKAIHIETATVAVSYLADLTKTERIKTLMASGGGGSAGRSGSGGAVSVPPANPASTAQAALTPAPAAPVPTTPVDGTYTFYPRLVGTKGGINSGGWLAKIVIRSGYMNLFLTSEAFGKGQHGGLSFGPPSTLILQDLNNPSKRFSAIMNPRWDEETGAWIITFQNVTSRRFKYIETQPNPPWVIEEIILGNPDE